ncbi:MAG: nucleoside-triphosphatase [Tissierellaceae bacterium]|nr:nucleoside-triphosphatase [Tissierellaceae bacterium]
MSKNKHLLITGSKGIGKTTLLKEILKNYDNFGGIRTYVTLGDDGLPSTVILGDISDNNVNSIIGKRIDNIMNPVVEGFEKVGLDILKKYSSSTKDTIIIDEIGFLELEATNYQAEILRLFEKKDMIVVLRKDNNSFIDKIIRHKNTFLVNLDKYTL